MNRKYSIGETVNFISRLRLPSAPEATYHIVAFRPDEEGERSYRIKGDVENYERIVLESDLKPVGTL
jgi:hypothetical protein